MRELTIRADGKHIEDLVYEVDVLRKSIIASGNNHACICWQEDGMLTYFDYVDGLPGFYWSETTGDSKESFTSLTRLIQYMKRCMSTTDPSEDGYTYLLTAPVWKVLEREDDATREAFYKLLGDIEIDL